MDNEGISNHFIDLVAFRKDLILWGKNHFRSFPWRDTKNPYHILIAEVFLHRTQAKQVVPVYNKFIKRYPDIKSLSSATKDDLYSYLDSLGLRWRVNLIIDMVQQINEQFEGQIPQKKSDLLSLPGVSDYIAAAVRCFAWEQADAIVDTNTVRVVGRIFDLEIKDSSRRNPHFRKNISLLLDVENPRDYNFALLDLAAQICTKVQPPKCNLCPINTCCLYASKIQLPSLDH